MNKPKLGMVVLYKTTEAQREAMRNVQDNVQDVLPAIIVSVWSEDCVNLKVMIDGNSTDIWVTSSLKGEMEGNWQFQD